MANIDSGKYNQTIKTMLTQKSHTIKISVYWPRSSLSISCESRIAGHEQASAVTGSVQANEVAVALNKANVRSSGQTRLA